MSSSILEQFWCLLARIFLDEEGGRTSFLSLEIRASEGTLAIDPFRGKEGDIMGCSIYCWVLSFLLSSQLEWGSLWFNYLRFLGISMVWKNQASRSSSFLSAYFLRNTLNQSISRSSSTEALFLESTTKHLPIRQLRLLEQAMGILIYTPLIIFLNRALKSFPLKGGSKQHISYITHPNDHTSPLAPQGSSLQTSGHAQYGVPVCVVAIQSLSILDMLRSPSFATLFEKKILAALMSLWRIFEECIFCSPFSN